MIFNIDAKDKYYFNEITLKIPDDFETENFQSLNLIFKSLKGETYSINKVEDILQEIDKVTLEEQFESISATVQEDIIENKIIFNFI